MNPSRLQVAKADILAFFNTKIPQVMKEKEVAAYLSAQRAGWRLAQSTSVHDFIDFLEKSGPLRRIKLDFPRGAETLYVWGTAPVFEVLLHLRPRCYYSHYTAMRLHGLTEQVPKTVYLTHERSTPSRTSVLTQAAIDRAFQNPARLSNNEAELDGWRITLLNGAFTGELGIIRMDAQQEPTQNMRLRVTNLERTLIDASVRPTYCGGIFEVAKAFEIAKADLSVNAMRAMLRKLGFAYPYHQVIGFYLERAGYRSRALDLMRQFPMEFDFYLAHGMSEQRYVRDWRLYVPSAF